MDWKESERKMLNTLKMYFFPGEKRRKGDPTSPPPTPSPWPTPPIRPDSIQGFIGSITISSSCRQKVDLELKKSLKIVSWKVKCMAKALDVNGAPSSSLLGLVGHINFRYSCKFCMVILRMVFLIQKCLAVL